ncbi:hypothetical protein OIU84_022393 [Salix udensis]|uniref:Pectinesterase inhibitor domain-containing protein n=1 Tax=Salix udensis TaxID=889485 RepID=A0AAD6PDT5_9ROSI|nr:hypothetical protein OIU84_022393 [Salix udensis]
MKPVTSFALLSFNPQPHPFSPRICCQCGHQSNREGIIALTLASSKAAETSQYIKTLLLNKTLDPVVDQALSDCSDQYLDAVQQLGDASSELLEDGRKDVRASVKAGIAAAQSCENGFKESSGSEILVSRNAMFRQLCNNVLVINKLLEEK